MGHSAPRGSPLWTTGTSSRHQRGQFWKPIGGQYSKPFDSQGIGVIPWSPQARGRLTRDWDYRSIRPETDEAFGRAADALLQGAAASGENGYKIELARRAVLRALQMSAAGTPKRMPALPASPFGDFAEEHSHV